MLDGPHAVMGPLAGCHLVATGFGEGRESPQELGGQLRGPHHGLQGVLGLGLARPPGEQFQLGLFLFVVSCSGGGFKAPSASCCEEGRGGRRKLALKAEPCVQHSQSGERVTTYLCVVCAH